jgi:hypothetical protein
MGEFLEAPRRGLGLSRSISGVQGVYHSLGLPSADKAPMVSASNIIIGRSIRI